MGMFNNFPTVGGKVFWTNVKVVGGWKLQQNQITGHYRILDTDEWRQWSGISLLNAEIAFANLVSQHAFQA
jgi:hypothetical protein